MPKSVAAGLPLTATGALAQQPAAATVESAIALMHRQRGGPPAATAPKAKAAGLPQAPKNVPNATVCPKTLHDPARQKSICAGGALLHQEMIKTLAQPSDQGVRATAG